MVASAAMTSGSNLSARHRTTTSLGVGTPICGSTPRNSAALPRRSGTLNDSFTPRGCVTPRCSGTPRKPASRGAMTFLVGGETFELPRPLLTIHSPTWAERLAQEPDLREVALEGEAASFRAFQGFLLGAEDVSQENVMQLLHWGVVMGIDYVSAQCESFLTTAQRDAFAPEELLEVAARHNMPLLYARMTERVAQGTHHLHVPCPVAHKAAGQPISTLPAAFASEHIRGDLIAAHVSMNLMRGDGEMRRRHRFAEHTALDETRQRSRLFWKSRGRFTQAPEEPPEHDWKKLQTVFPHHSFRGSDWPVVAHETQPRTGQSGTGLASAARGLRYL